MGLDVSAYRKLTKLDAIASEDHEPLLRSTLEPYEGNWFRVYHEPHFPGRADELEDRAFYAYEECGEGVSVGYSGHMHFRDELAKLSGWALSSYEQYGKQWPSYCASAWNADGGPFWELINFSDCEGTIGAAVCAKLAKDFAEYQTKADAHENLRFRALYADWRKACEFAADGGALNFH